MRPGFNFLSQLETETRDGFAAMKMVAGVLALTKILPQVSSVLT